MTATKPTADFSADHYLSVAEGYATAGQWDRAAEVCRRGVVAHPADGRLWEKYGVAAWATDDWPTAVWTLEAGDLFGPLRPVGRLALADAYLAVGRSADAIRTLRFLARQKDCNPDLLPFVAGRLFRVGRYDLAAAVWRRVIRRRPSWADAHYQYAACLWAQDAAPEDLFIPLNEAVLLAPEVPRYALALANVWLDIDCPADAAIVLAGVDLATVVCPETLAHMAAMYLRVGDPVQAAVCEARVCELHDMGALSSDPS